MLKYTNKTLFVSLCNCIYQVQQILGCIQIRILRQIATDYQHLMELAHLNTDWLQGLW